MDSIKKIITHKDAKAFLDTKKGIEKKFKSAIALADCARNGAEVYINGMQKSPKQIEALNSFYYKKYKDGKTYEVYTSERDGVTILETINQYTLKY